jgi:large subunit ribosomal protein L28
MARCELTGKGPVAARLVSHSNIKSNRVLQPNIQNKRLFSQALGKLVRLNVATSAVRDMEHVGGFDPFVLRQKDDKMSLRARRVKKAIRDRLAGKTGKKSKQKTQEAPQAEA